MFVSVIFLFAATKYLTRITLKREVCPTVKGTHEAVRKEQGWKQLTALAARTCLHLGRPGGTGGNAGPPWLSSAEGTVRSLQGGSPSPANPL